MTRRTIGLVAALWATGACGGMDGACSAEMRNRALKAELKALEAQAAEYENTAAKRAEAIRVLTVAAELMDGRRTAPPRLRTHAREIYADGTAAPVFFDATKGKVKNKDVWLSLTPGAQYRFEAEVKVENLVGTDRVKFGGFVPIKGAATQWPGCRATGAGTFDWQRIGFSYRLPHGGSFMLSIGPSGGTGKVWFRNVRVFEVTEVEE